MDAGSSVVGSNDGFEIVALPPFLLAVTICSQCGSGGHFFGLVCYGFLDIGAIHHREGGSVGGDDGRRGIRDKPRLDLGLGRNGEGGRLSARRQLICSGLRSDESVNWRR